MPVIDATIFSAATARSDLIAQIGKPLCGPCDRRGHFPAETFQAADDRRSLLDLCVLPRKLIGVEIFRREQLLLPGERVVMRRCVPLPAARYLRSDEPATPRALPGLRDRTLGSATPFVGSPVFVWSVSEPALESIPTRSQAVSRSCGLARRQPRAALHTTITFRTFSMVTRPLLQNVAVKRLGWSSRIRNLSQSRPFVHNCARLHNTIDVCFSRKVGGEEASEIRRAENQELAVPYRDHVGRAPTPAQERHLAKEVAAPEPHLFFGKDDLYGSGRNEKYMCSPVPGAE